MKSNQNQKVEINSRGSLGLLALGDVGFRLWKKAIADSKPDANQHEEE